jgi:DNA replication and repair protein RecF
LIIKNLQLDNFRNLEQVQLTAHRRLNVFCGDNGAGKTSIIEALVVLSRGRSFRTTLATDLIGPASATFRVFAQGEDQSGIRQRLGLERSGKRWRGRKNGRDVSQLSELTRSLPVVLLEPDSHLLVSGAPDIRRKFLDWGMFHVKHDFLDLWRRYSLALKQRNAALRLRQDDVLDSLEPIVADQGTRLSEHRRAHCDAVAASLRPMLEELNAGLAEIRLEYRPGWTGGSLEDSLRRNRSRDLERGHTMSGPHRGDLGFLCGEGDARSILSRGEQKLMAAALLLVQADLLANVGELPVLLLDDLASEFDQGHFQRVLDRSLASGAQVWLTGTRQEMLTGDGTMFHVEQGRVTEVI